MSITQTVERSAPAWLITEAYAEYRLGTLKSGKEAEVFLVERTSAKGSCLLAHKRYRPRHPAQGELKELGFSKGTIYRSDKVYRAGWNLDTRERKAVNGRSAFGQELSAQMWPINELQMLRRAWVAGAMVPYPVGFQDDGILMQFVGDGLMAAPRVVDARLDRAGLIGAWEQLLTSLRLLTRAGVVHADLSVYNLLWWEGRLVVIDFPQAVDVHTNPAAPGLLHRDVLNVAEWFGRRRVNIDPERVFGALMAEMF